MVSQKEIDFSYHETVSRQFEEYNRQLDIAIKALKFYKNHCKDKYKCGVGDTAEIALIHLGIRDE